MADCKNLNARRQREESPKTFPRTKFGEMNPQNSQGQKPDAQMYLKIQSKALTARQPKLDSKLTYKSGQKRIKNNQFKNPNEWKGS
jgi:hypothetical protein